MNTTNFICSSNNTKKKGGHRTEKDVCLAIENKEKRTERKSEKKRSGDEAMLSTTDTTPSVNYPTEAYRFTNTATKIAFLSGNE